MATNQTACRSNKTKKKKNNTSNNIKIIYNKLVYLHCTDVEDISFRIQIKGAVIKFAAGKTA